LQEQLVRQQNFALQHQLAGMGQQQPGATLVASGGVAAFQPASGATTAEVVLASDGAFTVTDLASKGEVDVGSVPTICQPEDQGLLSPAGMAAAAAIRARFTANEVDEPGAPGGDVTMQDAAIGCEADLAAAGAAAAATAAAATAATAAAAITGLGPDGDVHVAMPPIAPDGTQQHLLAQPPQAFSTQVPATLEEPATLPTCCSVCGGEGTYCGSLEEALAESSMQEKAYARNGRTDRLIACQGCLAAAVHTSCLEQGIIAWRCRACSTNGNADFTRGHTIRGCASKDEADLAPASATLAVSYFSLGDAGDHTFPMPLCMGCPHSLRIATRVSDL